MSNSAEQLYCSVDLEFTGFDPSRDQILEIGFAFFKVSTQGLEIVEEWSQVFKPSIEVHPKILGLTGITQEELDSAPEFSEHREFLQEKLGDAVIVGHNPVMDVKFLEGYGIKLSGKVIDTLELVQFILPTHHSYNLENLVHYFGIQHHKAHRALGDAISTVAVLENLIRVYKQFSTKLKQELAQVFERGEFLWTGLLKSVWEVRPSQANDSLAHATADRQSEHLVLKENLITVDEVAIDHEIRVAKGLQHSGDPAVMAVADPGMVMRLWKDGHAHGVFKSEDTYSSDAFNQFLSRAQTSEELRFCLKVIVWLHTNWQTEVVNELNISFFGGQFRQFIVGGEPQVRDENLIAIDFPTLQTLTDAKPNTLNGRELVICDMQSFERFISSGYGSRLSWNGVLYSLRLVYNPETDFGNMKAKDKVMAALVNADLFFGLSYMLLHRSFASEQFVTITDLIERHPNVYNKLTKAAGNLKKKLEGVLEEVESKELLRAADYLENFFTEAAGRVKWITVDEHNMAFTDQPLDISESVAKLSTPYSNVRFTEVVASRPLLSYLVDRLGLNTELSELPPKILPKNFDVELAGNDIDQEGLFNLLSELEKPAIVLMPTLVSIKEFYNNYYSEIKKNSALFAQGYSGGGNKMFRNFSINPKSVLMVTAGFMAKQNYRIFAKNIIFTGLPVADVAHPYTAALLSHWQSSHPDLAEVFSHAKIFAAMKKLKNSGKITIKIFGMDKNNLFGDNSR